MERTEYSKLFEGLSNCVEDVLYEKYTLDMYINLLYNIQQLAQDRLNNVLELNHVDSKLASRLDDDLDKCNLDHKIETNDDDYDECIVTIYF